MSWHGEEEEEFELGLRLDREHARRLWAFLRPHLRLFVWTFLLLLFLFGLELAGPWIVRLVIDGPVTRMLEGGGSINLNTLAPYLLSFAGMMLCLWGGQFGQLLLAATAGQRVVRDLRVTLFRHVSFLSPDYFDRTATGRLVTRISSDCENLSELFTTGVVATLIDLLKLLGLFLALLWVSPSLTLVVVLASPVLVAATWLFQRKARRAYRQVRGRTSRLTSWFAEAMQGMRITRLFGREQKVSQRYAELNRDTRASWITTIIMFGLFFSIVDFGTGGTQAGLLAKAGFEIKAGQLSYGAFAQFWLYFELMLGPIRELGEKYNVIQSAFASAERIFHILDEVPSLPVKESAQAPVEGGIRFDNVDFSYEPDVPVLRGIDFELRPGGGVAIVGPTGAGKTTLIQLLARFRDPDAGRVSVGGLDLRDLDLQAHRRRVGIVLQDVFLFASDILENVRLWDPSISRERVVSALEAVQALDLVERAGGLEAEVEERGATFSQGERQLLAFARALVHDPEILVLDEATANIDTPTERKIQQAMEVVMRGRTTLVIAHRLSTIQSADLILVMDRGRIVERGSHADLIDRGGLYTRLAQAID
ncbi:MAG: ABC transporter ATP-binding protein [Planctomycetota bacterium]